jgi:hypothetical protein
MRFTLPAFAYKKDDALRLFKIAYKKQAELRHRRPLCLFLAVITFVPHSYRQ